VHLYLLDGDGSLAGHAVNDHTGAYVGAAEPGRAARVIERLVALTADHTHPRSSIVLAVTGWGRWSTQFRQGRLARAEDDLHALVRDGAACGVTVLIGGDRELTTARFFALVPNRVYLPLGAHQETTMTWPRIPPVDAVRGRGLVQGRITGGSPDAVGQLVLAAGPSFSPRPAPSRVPFPVHPLPRSVTFGELRTTGLHGDDLRPYRLDVRGGEAILVLGHASSGRSNVLRVLEASNSLLHPRLRVLAPWRARTPGNSAVYWRSLSEIAGSSFQQTLLLVDDADQLPADVQLVLSSLVTRGAAAVLTAAPNPSLMTRVPLSLQARGSGRGLVLSPRNPSDGDFLGVRLESGGPAVPGRAVACDSSGTHEVQVAHAPRASGQEKDLGSCGPDPEPIPTASSRTWWSGR
jgi:S-DNA-T family DNA segregation ATPase FtsK/SpoIIIE